MGNMTFSYVSFSGTGQDQPLRQALLAHGCTIRPISCDDWLNADAFSPARPTILFLAQPDYPRAAILSALERAHTPCLGVYGSDETPWDSELLNYCSEFIRWPCHHDELILRLQRLRCLYRLHQPPDFESELLEEAVQLNMIGHSPAFQNVVHTIRKLARSDAPVLIKGATGTGKELAARAIHYLSARRDKPFIPVNCGAIPDNLIENELFGHQRGAYTDAKDSQPGMVTLANGGTLFLDEVESLSMKAQVALLRFLQDGGFRPLGGRLLQTANTRIIAASNANLAKLIEQGTFRADLRYRLDVLTLSIPSLSERGGRDIELLAMHFVAQYRKRYEQPNKSLHPDTLRWLRAHPWPGNVRELEHLIHREFLLADNDTIYYVGDARDTERRVHPHDRRRVPAADMMLRDAKAHILAEFEKGYVERLLRETSGNVSAAARLAGKERRAFGKIVKKNGIDSQRFRVAKEPETRS